MAQFAAVFTKPFLRFLHKRTTFLLPALRPFAGGRCILNSSICMSNTSKSSRSIFWVEHCSQNPTQASMRSSRYTWNTRVTAPCVTNQTTPLTTWQYGCLCWLRKHLEGLLSSHAQRAHETCTFPIAKFENALPTFSPPTLDYTFSTELTKSQSKVAHHHPVWQLHFDMAHEKETMSCGDESNRGLLPTHLLPVPQCLIVILDWPPT